ncbi:SIMPL domain-containing protein [Halorhabdus amylolytica]|uniref:SIMPL domain-containing protein n=1 Tax=Halorhabdus amylolytica TaxID=2559573 RepID=UPI0010AA0FB6|nr:SIMPL domain-containing protein [Halorhabdus amylolytica]
MRTNRILLVVTLVAVTVLAAVGVAVAVSPDGQADEPNRQIEVAASGDVSADPDQAQLRVGVVATTDDAAIARTQVAENVTSLRSTLEELGIPDDRVETDYYNIREVREGPESERATQYRAIHAFEITLDDTDRVGEVIDGVVDSGANRVQGVSFTLSVDRRADLRQKALRNAMDAARKEARTLANSADLTVEGAAAISASDVNVRPYRVEQAMMTETADAGGSTSIESGPVDVSASVQVVYNATA